MNAEDTEDSEATLTASEDEQGYQEMPITETVYRQRKADLEHEAELLERGEHPAYMKRLQELEQQRQQALDDALGAKLREQAWADREYLLELQAAEEEFERSKRDLLATRLDELEKLKEQYLYELVNGRPDEDRATEMGLFLERRTRMQAKKNAVAAKSPPTKAKVVFQLARAEIEEDLEAIGGDSCAASSGAGSSGTSTERSKEQPRPTWLDLQEGMLVSIIGQRMSPIVGTIISKQASDLRIRMNTGRIVHVLRAHLTHGGLYVIPRFNAP